MRLPVGLEDTTVRYSKFDGLMEVVASRIGIHKDGKANGIDAAPVTGQIHPFVWCCHLYRHRHVAALFYSTRREFYEYTVFEVEESAAITTKHLGLRRSKELGGNCTQYMASRKRLYAYIRFGYGIHLSLRITSQRGVLSVLYYVCFHILSVCPSVRLSVRLSVLPALITASHFYFQRHYCIRRRFRK